MFQTTNQLISGPIAYNLIVSTPAFIRLLVGCLLEGETYILVTRTNHLFLAHGTPDFWINKGVGSSKVVTSLGSQFTTNFVPNFILRFPVIPFWHYKPIWSLLYETSSRNAIGFFERSFFRPQVGWWNKMKPTNPNAHTYVNGTDVNTHGYAVTHNTFLQ